MSETFASVAEIDEVGFAEPANPAAESESKHGVPGLSDAEVESRIAELEAMVAPLITANAQQLVICERLGGMEMTLSEAVGIIWPTSVKGAMVLEGASSVRAEIESMLNRRKDELEEEAEPEETAEGDESEEAEPAENKKAQQSGTEVKVQKETVDANTAEGEEQSQNGTDTAVHNEASADKPEKTAEPVSRSVAKAEAVAVAKPVQNKSKQSGKGVAKAEAQASPARSSIDRNGTASAVTPKPKVTVVTSSASGSSAPESVISQSNQEPTPAAASLKERFKETKRQMPTFKIPKTEAVENPMVQEGAPSVNEELTTDQEMESLVLPTANTVTAEPEIMEPLSLEMEYADASLETAEPVEKTEAAEDEPAPRIFDYQMDADSLIDFIEEEVLLIHPEEVGAATTELYLFSDMLTGEIIEGYLEAEEEPMPWQNDESNPVGTIENTGPERPIRLSLAVEEIEDSLIQLTESIEAGDAETIEEANEILDKIIEVLATAEAVKAENIISEAEVQEELEELFTELLNQMDIDYTPELIESLAQLTLKLQVRREHRAPKEIADDEPHDIGTHEAIKQLLLGVSTLKQANNKVYTIGRSALLLYRLGALIAA